MTICRMTELDLPEIIPLAQQLGYPSTIKQLQSRFASMNSASETALFVGEEFGAVIAFMQVQENATLMSGPRAELNGVVVDESLRGRGLGKQMMNAAEDWAKSRGLPKLRLGSQTSRTDTHQFYLKNGYSVEKTWFVFSKRFLER